MNYKDGIKLIEKAQNKDIEEKLYERWVLEITSNSYVTEKIDFETYKSNFSITKTQLKDNAEIEDIVKKTEIIIEKDKKRVRMPGRL